MAFFSKQYTITASAATLTSIMSGVTGTFGGGSLAFGTTGRPINSVSIIGKSGNAATAYVGNSNVTNVPANAGGEFTTALSFIYERPTDPFRGITTDDLYVVGTASDVALIALDAD